MKNSCWLFVCCSQQYCFIGEIFVDTEKHLAVTYKKDYIDFCVLARLNMDFGVLARLKKLTTEYMGAIVL